MPQFRNSVLTIGASDCDVVILDPRFLGELKDIPDHVISQAVAVEEVSLLLFSLRFVVVVRS